MKRILLFCMTVLIAASCADFPTVLYQGLMFGTMQGYATMHGDDGREYHFTNLTADTSVPTEGRIVAAFYATSQIQGAENAYEAELINYSLPVYKEPVPCATAGDSEALGTEPVQIADGYFGGGCLNLTCNAYFGPNANVKHELFLAVDNYSAPSDTLRLTLRHDAHEDSIIGAEIMEFTIKSFYASFPLVDLLPESGEKVVSISWYWDDEWHTDVRTIKR